MSNPQSSPLCLNNRPAKLKTVLHLQENRTTLPRHNKPIMTMMMMLVKKRKKNNYKRIKSFLTLNNKTKNSFKTNQRTRTYYMRINSSKRSNNNNKSKHHPLQNSKRNLKSQNFHDLVAANFIRPKTHAEIEHTSEQPSPLQFYKDASNHLLPYFSGNFLTLPQQMMTLSNSLL